MQTQNKRRRVAREMGAGAVDSGGAAAGALAVPGEDPERLMKVVEDLKEENRLLRRVLAESVPPSFSIAQYNLLAGYLGNNMEPWFLYGVDLSPEERQAVRNKHQEKDESGKYKYSGWPNYAKGILTDEQIQKVEEVHRNSFDWEGRKVRLLEQALRLDADILSFVECDHYDDISGTTPTFTGHDPGPGFWKAAMSDRGYDSYWMKRPRDNSHDGCGLFWRRCRFELIAASGENIVDGMRGGREVKDRICIAALLRMRYWQQNVLVVSTHLARNPEEKRQEWLRARQIGHMMRFVGQFAEQHGALNAPVVIAGDMNSSNFCRVRGLAEAMLIMCGEVAKDQVVHPMLFEARDVPTGATSVTSCRSVRIDAILYQRRALALKSVIDYPPPDCPIPTPEHPSDHMPVKAVFSVCSNTQNRSFSAACFVKTLLGIDIPAPLNGTQLTEAFLYFDWNNRGSLEKEDMLRSLCELDIGLRETEQQQIAALLAENQTCDVVTGECKLYLDDFKRVYGNQLKRRLTQRTELEWAFSMMDENGDGKLSLEELQECFRQASPVDVTPEALQEIFQQADKDGDGLISFEEFLEHTAANYGRFGLGGSRMGAKQDQYSWCAPPTAFGSTFK
eukprot:Hpha_TRINITY_DN2734_c0_g1::TRINITY_DN2734_c0_g1_i1::g.110315::m.110315